MYRMMEFCGASRKPHLVKMRMRKEGHVLQTLYPLVAPTVRPLTMKRCKLAKINTIGKATVEETAIRSFHRVPYSPLNLFNATVIGCIDSLLVRVRAKTNSPQVCTNASAPTVIKPGVTRGSTTR